MSRTRPIIALTCTALTCVAVLTGCAPQLQTGGDSAAPQTTAQAAPLWADFSDEGIVWSDGKQACVARAPQMQPVCPRLPAPTGPVAWDLAGRAWVALPRQGLVTTLDGPPHSQVVGRAVAMSAQAVYREDGSALGYNGEPRAGVVGRADVVLTAQGADYALVAGRVVEVGSNLIANAVGPYLYRTQGIGGTVASANLPTAVVGGQRYQLRSQTAHQRQPWALLRGGSVVATAAEPHAIGNVGGQLWGLVAPVSQPAECGASAPAVPSCTPPFQPMRLVR